MNKDIRLLFIHIPKSAGISFYNGLAGSIGIDRSLRFALGSKADQDMYLKMTAEEIRQYRFISGHFTLPFFLRNKIEDYKIVTVLRNPLDRELSAYFYMKTWDKHPQHEEIKSMNLYQYLAYREQQGGNLQCWQVCGENSFEKAKAAIDKLYFLTATVEYIEEFSTALEERLELPKVLLKHDNVTSFRMTADELHPNIVATFNALNQDDMALYYYVKKKFENDVLGR